MRSSEESVGEAPHDLDLTQPQLNILANDDTLPLSIKVPANHPAGQHSVNSDLDASIPYETAEQHPENSDLDVTIPYGSDKQGPVNSDLDVTIPYESATEKLSLWVSLDQKSSSASQLVTDQ